LTIQKVHNVKAGETGKELIWSITRHKHCNQEVEIHSAGEGYNFMTLRTLTAITLTTHWLNYNNL